jgi:ABC-type antimicrobial peptide transport system, permease component
MVYNYIKTAFRVFVKNKSFGIINMVGLAAGTVCCLYILLYINDQYSFDKHHKDAGDIYRITSHLSSSGDAMAHLATCSPPVAPAMKKDFAEVVEYTRVVPTIGVSQHLLRYKDKSFYETNVVFADSTFFNVFTYQFVQGHATSALQQPYSIVLDKQTANKLFGKEEAIGKRIEIDNAYGRNDFLVTGVIDASLGKSHIQARIFMSMNSGSMGDFVRSNNNWSGQNFTNSYIKLRPSTAMASIEKKLPAFLNQYAADQLKTMGMKKEIHLQPITSIHTTPGYEAEMSKAISPTFLKILLLIAILIQLIACINFMNLSTANASKRAKDVGVRKVIGASKKQLVKQFIGESVFMAFLSVLMAVPLLVMALPLFNQLTGTELPFSIFTDYRMILVLLGFALLTGVVAGSYPAFYLSSFAAVKVIKGNFSSHISAAGIRKALVVFQFALSICLITGIVVIWYQLQFIKNKDLGFIKEQRLVFSFHTQDNIEKMDAFSNSLREISDVKAISKTNNYPSQFVYNDIKLFPSGGNMETAKVVQFMRTDEQFINTTGIHLISGRNFTRNDSNAVIINQTYLQQLGITAEQAIGAKLHSQRSRDRIVNYEIAGVMKDINYNSLHEPVKPFMLVFENETQNLTHVLVAVNTTDYNAMLSKMQDVWRRFFPSTPFEYRFLDEQVQKQYEAEMTIGRIINAFAVMAIVISCLGLFGLSAFTAEQRKKEIGIRKVLGAGSWTLTGLLSKDFLKLVLIAIIVATPISYWAANSWLQGFVYRIVLSWWIFTISGLLALFIALATVGGNAIRAAMGNPINNLRTE